ncbi:hypothetical protein BGZ88_012049 [Linnemannia elongata]|nr:hypothetical protein BGZ88_012049 [Linnemannia elongata]
MTDYIVDISDDSQTTTLASYISSPSAEVHASSSTGSSNSIGDTELVESSSSINAYRWYPQESLGDSSATDRVLTLSEEHHPSVKIDASKKLTSWLIPRPAEHKEGAFYDIVLGVSTRNLNIDSIESILVGFDQVQSIENDFENDGFECEVIQPHELKRLSSLGSLTEDNEKDPKVLRWKLFNRYYGYKDGVRVSFDFSTWPELPVEFGFLDLHFVELCIDSPTLYKTDPLYREHCQHASWLIDVNRSGCPEYDRLTEELKRVRFCRHSGDGKIAVIKTVVGEAEYLEVWDLENHDPASKSTRYFKEERGVLIADNNDGSERAPLKPYCAMPIAWMPLARGEVDFSLSWDGSLVAVMEIQQPVAEHDKVNEAPAKPHRSLFAVYKCGRHNDGTSPKASSSNTFIRQDVERTCQGLREYKGSGIFHMVDKSNPDPKDELFVTYNGQFIDVYSAFEDWTPRRRIAMDSTIVDSVQSTSVFSSVINNQLRGRFITTCSESVAFTFDIVLGTLVSFTSVPSFEELAFMSACASMSEDGSLIAIPRFRGLSIYRTETWTLHGSYDFHDIGPEECVSSVQFVCDDSILSVCVAPTYNFYLQTRPGYLLDVTTMKRVDRVAPDGSECWIVKHMDGSVQGLSYLGNTTVRHMRLEERAYHSNPKSPTRCNGQCQDPNLHDQDDIEGTSASGLHLKAETTETYIGSHLKREKRSSLTVTMTDTTSSLAKKMVVPLPDGAVIHKKSFVSAYRYLLVEAFGTLMVWSVPTTFDGDFRLQVILDVPVFYDFWICSHGYIRYQYGEEGDIEILNHIAHPISNTATNFFLDGLRTAVDIYEFAEPGVKQDILRYYGEYLNYYPLPGDLASNILVRTANLWTPSSRKILYDFFKNLLSLSSVRWVPLQEMTIEINPVAILLEPASWDSMAMGLLEITIDYCLHQARVEKNRQFLLPILQCIESLVDPKQQYSDLVRKIYREMAYFPAQGREFIIDHHALASPLEFQWRFWRPYPWGLHQHKDQVLQLDLDGTPKPPKSNFTRDIFQASFNLLWRRPEDEESQQEPNQRGEEALVQTLFSWPQAIWKMVLRKCKLRYNTTVECHPFELETLDNPALKALVEFKWNTIGFNYWLIRFLGQVCYYILVLTAIFLQIYGKQEQDAPKEGEKKSNLGQDGLFISIIVVAFIFLWLEFVQLLKDKRGYIRSIYNLVDLFVFLLPLAGAVNQFLIIRGVIEKGLNPGLLSFSILFIFLHFLFELRVFQAVCHFVSIIIRTIYAIRVFIFVFAGGLLGFSIAILHLLHGCDVEKCSYFTDGFSNNLFRAFSVTYFMMGSNYDQVEKGFTSDSFAFHGMMMIFFFFTVIVMLNVLIALINNAICDGDQSWQLDWMEYRMRYIESAENMTYDIPGFRENHNYFPDTIYYTATGQRVRDYTKETQRLIDEAGRSSVSETTTALTTPVVATSVTTVVESPVSAAVEPVVSAIVDKRSPETTLVRRATVTAATSTSKAAAAPMAKTAGTTDENDLMSMIRQQHEDQIRRAEEQRRQYEEQMRRSDEQMKLLAEQSRRLEEQRLAMMDLQSELKSLKESGDR